LDDFITSLNKIQQARTLGLYVWTTSWLAFYKGEQTAYHLVMEILVQ